MSEYKKMAGKILKIYLFRHGQTTFNRDGKFTGHLDSKLTSLGKKQANIIAKKLKNKEFGIAFHTSLKRSIQTLNPVLKYHPECKTILEDDRMIERGYGILQGSTHEQFIKSKGQEEYDAIHRGFNVTVPKGESFAMVEKRVKSFISDLKKIMKDNKCNVAISAHGNSIRLFRKIMEKASVEETISWNIPFDKYYEYSIKI